MACFIGGELDEHNKGKYYRKNSLVKLVVQKRRFERKAYHSRDVRYFHVIPWGKRTYLIADEQMISFCNSVNSGFDERRIATGRYYIKRGGMDHSVKGYPVVPRKYNDYILKRPIAGFISRTRTTGKGRMRVVEAQVTVGKSNGLKKGMELYTSFNYGFCTLYLIKIGEDSSVVRVREFSDERMPEVGTKISTRRRLLD